MKKEYIKPIVVIESFQLDAAIAGSCKDDAKDQGLTYIKLGFSENGCTFDNGQFFNESQCYNNVVTPGADENDQFCYHGPLWGFVFINS